jgi:hypothetical protein
MLDGNGDNTGDALVNRYGELVCDSASRCGGSPWASFPSSYRYPERRNTGLSTEGARPHVRPP